jgi:endonuclease/exonuclease/phosphatase family metal-dependent hydrolase
MRVATFNILHGRSPADDLVDVDRYADSIKRLDADVLALQEVDRNQPRSQHADLTSIAAEALGADHHQFVAAISGTPGAVWSAATGDAQPDDAAYGVALLSRYPVLGWRTIRLPPVPVKVPLRFPGQLRPEWVRDEPRVAVVAEIDAPGGRLSVVGTHLSYLAWWNGLQLRRLVEGLGRIHTPWMLLGDLNMQPPRAERLTGLTELVSGLTFPHLEPETQIDHVLGSDGLRASGGAVDLPMSDHRALVADLE